MELEKYKSDSQVNFFFTNSHQTRLFNKRDLIYKVGDKISELYVILDGEVESLINKKSKGTIKTLKKGSVLGLMDTILNREYSKNMVAKSKVSLAIIDKKRFVEKLHSNPFQFSLIKSLAIDVDIEKPNIWS